METNPTKRRLSAFLSLVIHPNKRESSGQPQHVETPKKEGRLRRLGRGIRRWRHSRNKDGSAQEACPYRHSKTSTAFSSSDGTLSIHCQGITSNDPKVVDLHAEQDEQEDAILIVDDAVLHDTDTHEEAIIPSSAVETDAVDDTIPGSSVVDDIVMAASPVEGDLDVAREAPITIDNKALEATESVPDVSTALSTPRCVYIRKRKEAKHFATSIMSSSSTNLPNKVVFWTDASLRKAQNNQVRGGTSVAQRQGGHWRVEYAHVVGTNSTAMLEALAILTALKIALHDCCGTESILILSDGQTCLTWLKKELELFPAMEQTIKELQATKCYARAAVFFSQAFTFQRLDRYSANDLQIELCLQILEAYSKLRQLGTTVEFHWVPGHSEVVGNVIADQWAFNACLWFADVTVSVNDREVLVMPLEPLKIDEPWSENCERLSKQRPAVTLLPQVLEDVKHSQFTLKAEKNIGAARKNTPSMLTIKELPKQAATHPVRKTSKEHKVRCTACRKRGHVREQCQFPEPCGLCKRLGHSEVNCDTKRICTLCNQTGHSRKQCQQQRKKKNKKMKTKTVVAQPDTIATVSEPTPSITIPEASLVVSLLHPTLMDRSLHGASTRHYRLGQVGLNPQLASRVKFRPNVALGLGSGF